MASLGARWLHVARMIFLLEEGVGGGELRCRGHALGYAGCRMADQCSGAGARSAAPFSQVSSEVDGTFFSPTMVGMIFLASRGVEMLREAAKLRATPPSCELRSYWFTFHLYWSRDDILCSQRLWIYCERHLSRLSTSRSLAQHCHEARIGPAASLNQVCSNLHVSFF